MYLNPTDHCPGITTKADQDVAKRLNFIEIKFPFKIRDIHKIDPHQCFWLGKSREKSNLCIKKSCEGKHADLLIIKKDKRHYVLIKSFNTFGYNDN